MSTDPYTKIWLRNAYHAQALFGPPVSILVTKLRLREGIVLAGTPVRLQRVLYFGEAANDG